ncbi:hypothetical protein LTR56_018373 [Elasticomyces elasticus]|nr:hypothetical protein LTR56_018373 [Elasticomyces elasticus]
MNDLALAGAIGTPFLVAFTLILCYCCFCLDRKPNMLFVVRKPKKDILPSHYPPGSFNHYDWRPFINTGTFNQDPQRPPATHQGTSTKGESETKCHDPCNHGGIHISATYGEPNWKPTRPAKPVKSKGGWRWVNDSSDEEDAKELDELRDKLTAVRGDNGRGPRHHPPPRPEFDDESVSAASASELEKAEQEVLEQKELAMLRAHARGRPYRSVSPLNNAAKRIIRVRQNGRKRERRAADDRRRHRRGRPEH